jgi:hypothetical protein
VKVRGISDIHTRVYALPGGASIALELVFDFSAVTWMRMIDDKKNTHSKV